MPIERARQRQLAFTADASHELRTPLSVIEANASLALAAERDGSWYRARLRARPGRVATHATARRGAALAGSLRRHSAAAGAASRSTSGLLVDQAADRFAALAEARSLVARGPPRGRGVTLSGAARVARPAHRRPARQRLPLRPGRRAASLVSVSPPDRRVVLTVDDSGPGHPRGPARARLRPLPPGDPTSPVAPGWASPSPTPSCAPPRVAGTSGTSPLGGARMSVSWPEAGSGAGGS